MLWWLGCVAEPDRLEPRRCISGRRCAELGQRVVNLALGVTRCGAEFEDCVVGEALFESGLAEVSSERAFNTAKVRDQPGCTGLANVPWTNVPEAAPVNLIVVRETVKLE